MFRTPKIFCFIFLASAVFSGNIFANEYILNGGFETGDFTGWEMINQGGGYWAVHDAEFVNPWLNEVVPPISGNYSAITEQYAQSAELLFQINIVIPNNLANAELTWSDRIINLAEEFDDTTSFNFTQNFYVLILENDLSEFVPIFATVPGNDLVQYGPNQRSINLTSILSSLSAGDQIAVAFLVGAEHAPLIVQVDDVSLNIETSIPVSIDIKPNSPNNTFNNNGSGVIPIAILGSETFDAMEIDVGSVSLQGLAVKAVGKSNKLLYHYSDVNNDGFDDLFCQIEDSDQVFEEGATSAYVSGNLNNGSAFHGSDLITIVP